MWIDPDWQQMLKESELVVLAEVVKGGEFVAKVRPLHTFKGAASEDFYVTGFNNHNWPADAIERENFRANGQYYLFLRRSEDAALLIELLTGPKADGLVQSASHFIRSIFRTSRSAKPPREALQAAEKGLVWSVWSPTSGDLPVAGDGVHVSLLGTSYPNNARMRARAPFERFLTAALAYHSSGNLDLVLLQETQQAIRREFAVETPAAVPIASEREQPSELAQQIAAYFLMGGRSYDDLFEAIARGPDGDARFILAWLLGAMADERAGNLLLMMLADNNSLVQGEVVRQLAKRPDPNRGTILLAQLSRAGAGGVYPQGLMDPVRNQLEGGKLEIVRALGEMKYAPAAPALIELLEQTDNAYGLRVVLGALESIGTRDYAPALEKALRNRDLVMTVADWVREHRMVELKPALERLVEESPKEIAGGSLWTAIDGLGKIGDETTAAQLTAHLQRLISREVPEFFDEGHTHAIIGALADLRYHAARAVVEQAFFYWLGVDRTFEAKPQLLETKRRLEREIEREARAHFRDFWSVRPRATVILKNRDALADGSADEPEYSFVLQVNIHPWFRSGVKADTLIGRLDGFRKGQGTLAVTCWNGNMGDSSGSNDPRIMGGVSSLFFFAYGQYVRNTQDPRDVSFVRFLLKSGLADEWGARAELSEAFETTPAP
jgi:hypothetical protein